MIPKILKCKARYYVFLAGQIASQDTSPQFGHITISSAVKINQFLLLFVQNIYYSTGAT